MFILVSQFPRHCTIRRNVFPYTIREKCVMKESRKQPRPLGFVILLENMEQNFITDTKNFSNEF
jgi:hypothetical protein